MIAVTIPLSINVHKRKKYKGKIIRYVTLAQEK
jgi:hypothetical protein